MKKRVPTVPYAVICMKHNSCVLSNGYQIGFHLILLQSILNAHNIFDFFKNDAKICVDVRI
jgi:hypothetical protein